MSDETTHKPRSSRRQRELEAEAREKHEQAERLKANGRDQKSSAWRAYTYSAADLKGKQFPEINYVVEQLIAEGLTLLAGRPKIGKSWLALAIAYAVAYGVAVLGGLATLQGDVLYCAMEDNPRRMQRRMRKLCWPNAAPWPQRLNMAHQWRRLDEGGVDDIADWAKSVECPRLCILDTLAGVRPKREKHETHYDGDYQALIEAHKLANESAFAILMLTHTRKMDAGDDQLDAISGTLGQVGCADTGLVLARTTQGSTLYVRGRDIEEAEHAISFSKDTCQWTILGEAAEVRRSETRQKIMAVLFKAKEPMSPKDIANATGIAVNTIYQRLPHMLEAGEVVKVGAGLYADPNKPFAYKDKEK